MKANKNYCGGCFVKKIKQEEMTDKELKKSRVKLEKSRVAMLARDKPRSLRDQKRHRNVDPRIGGL